MSDSYKTAAAAVTGILRRYYPVLVLAALFFAHTASNTAWLRMNELPPHNDTAYHLVAAMRIVDSAPTLAGRVEYGLHKAVLGFYPPLFHWVMAASIMCVDRSKDGAILANVPFVLLLLISLYLIGRAMGSRKTGLLAGIILLSYPYIFDVARLPLPDFALTSMVAFSFCCLLYAKDFSRWKQSLVFGVTLGLGMLTKQVFVFFIIGPFLASLVYGLATRPQRWKTAFHAALAVLAGVAVCGYWYFPRLGELTRYYVRVGYYWMDNTYPIFSKTSLFFYAKGLYTHQVLLPMLVLFVAALLYWLWRGESRRFKVLLLAGFVGSYIAFTLIATKEVKTTIPLLVYCAMITSVGIGSLRDRDIKYFVTAVVSAFAVLQYVTISFPVNERFSRLVAEYSYGNPDYSVFRYRGGYRPVSVDYRADDLVALIRKFGAPMPRVGAFVYTMSNGTPDTINNVLASHWSVTYCCIRYNRPYRIIPIDNNSPMRDRAEINVAVMPELKRDEFMSRVPGTKTRVAALAMPDSSRILVYTVKQDTAVDEGRS